MDGSAELLQLAHLLRTGAGAARDIGTLRPKDRQAIAQLAEQADVMAMQLEAIVIGSGDEPEGGS